MGKYKKVGFEEVFIDYENLYYFWGMESMPQKIRNIFL